MSKICLDTEIYVLYRNIVGRSADVTHSSDAINQGR